MIPIRFGTDGWRAQIAYDYTFDRVSWATRAVSEVMREKSPKLNKMIVGYDRRFLSQRFAETAATILAQNGYDVLLPQTPLPTPTIAWATKTEAGVAGAVMITASHNPPDWNGFKFKEPFGGSARPTLTKEFEARIDRLGESAANTPPAADFEKYMREGRIKTYDPIEPYFRAVLSLVDGELIRKRAPKVGVDVMHGAAAGVFGRLLRSIGVEVFEIHSEENPGFRGVPPEPIAKNIAELCETVRTKKLDCGLANDGDADRLGAVDETGEAFTTQQILSVVYRHMLKNRGKRWNICRSASTTRMVDLVAKRAGLQCYETPVGFKHIAEKMVAGEAQIGGEESGGIGIVDHIPDRDGLLTGLLLLELMAMEGKGLRKIYDDLCREERPYFFTRFDLTLDPAQADRAFERLRANPPQSWNGQEVGELLTMDGYKFYMKNGNWLLIRKSGTEPIFRLYAEAESIPAADELVASAKKFVTS